MPVKSKKDFDHALNQVDELVRLASFYARDGAYHSAAKRLEEAAKEMTKAANIRDGWMEGKP